MLDSAARPARRGNEFVEDNIRNIGLAIQATGESGGAMGDVFSEFAKFGYTAEQVNKLLDDMAAQGDLGQFNFAEFAKNAPAVFSAYSVIGTTPEDMKNAYAAMQIIAAGTRSPEIAVTALNSTMNELTDPDKQKKLGRLGISVRDGAVQFRDFNDIMFDIVNRAKEMGNADYFGTIFGSLSMNAVRSYVNQGERMYANLIDLGDTSGLMQSKAAEMAKTLESNLKNLQTAFLSFAINNLTAGRRRQPLTTRGAGGDA
jgi:TP901 family phage tail tape measure protein